MGEIIFRYTAEPEQVRENNFQYTHEDLQLQKLTYQRCAVTSDTSLFNRPVAVTKMAAGLTDLRALFNVENKESITDCNKITEIHEDIYSNINSIINIQHDKYAYIDKEYAMHTDTYADVPDIAFATKEWSMDILDIIFLKTALHMNILDSVSARTSLNINIIKNDIGIKKDWYLNELPFVMPLYYARHANKLPNYMLSTYIKELSIPECITTARDHIEFNVFYQNAMWQHNKILQFFRNDTAYKDCSLLNIIYQRALNIDNNDMKIYDNMSIYANEPTMKILPNDIDMKLNDRDFKIYQDYTISSYGSNFKIYQDNTVSSYNRDFSIQSQIYGDIDGCSFNIYEYEEAYKTDNIIQLYNDISSALPDVSNINIDDILNTWSGNDIVNINNIINGIDDNNNINVQESYNAKISHNDILNVNNQLFAKDNIDNIQVLNHYSFGQRDNTAIKNIIYSGIPNNKNKIIETQVLLAAPKGAAKDTLCNIGYSFARYLKPTYAFDMDVFAIKGIEYCLCLESTLCEDYIGSGGYISNIEMTYKSNLNSNVNSKLYQLSDQLMKALENGILSGDNINTPEYGFIGDVIYTKLDSYSCANTNKLSQLKSSNKDINKSQIQITFDRIYKDFRLMRNDIIISCIERSFMISEDLARLSKDSNGGNIVSAEFLWRDLSTLRITEQQLKFNTHRTFTLYDPVYYMTKDTLSMKILAVPWNVTKENADTKLLWEQLRIDTKEQNLKIYRRTHEMIKEFNILSIQADMFRLTSKAISTMYTHRVNMPSWERLYGMIVPVSKIANNPIYIDRIDHMVKKSYTGGIDLHSDIFASIISCKALSIFQDILVNSRPYMNLMLEMTEELVTKSKVHIAIHDIYWANKDGHNINLFEDKWVYKDSKVINIFKDEWVTKDVKQLSVFDIWQTAKAPKDLSIFEDIFATKDGKIINLFKDEWVTKEHNLHIFDDIFAKQFSELSYYDYGVWGYKDKDLSLFTQESVKSSKDITLNFAVDAQKKAKDCYYYTTILVDKAAKEVPLAQAIAWAEKVRKQCGIHKDDFGNWAWVYETPDPFYGDPYGIDELLLPENDTRYEDFEEVIFDKVHMRPKNPIKQIDATTFIAKYPIRHPSPKFSDIAVDYEKSAIKVQNYFGIETSVMKEVFLKYYRIWQSKIFEFSIMSMTQAVNKMLEYMYVWIMDFFPLEQIEAALRVLKLIRWYGESSIIQNSQYIITFEYDTLESKLTSGTCFVPNNLSTNDTMIIDASLGVIKVNPIYIGSSQDIYVEFYINNKNNTTFTFSLSNTVGSVNIYINGQLRDTKSSSILNVTYSLPFTGGTNVIRIEKKASHNLNQMFYIGNIKVPKCAFKNLAIDFDPQLRAGNKPLDDVAKKIVAYANIHDDMKEAYEVAMKANLGISETYKKMLEYWKIHHENKSKGKRLTIREL